MKTKQREVGRRVSEWLSLPEEVLLSLPIVEMIGDRRLRIENYEGVIEYTDNIIRLNTNAQMLKISGFHLTIVTMTREEMVIEGQIAAVEYVR